MICGKCRYYVTRPFDENVCSKTGKVVPHLAKRDCFEDRAVDVVSTADPKTNGEMNEIFEKRCPSCGKTLPVSELYKNASTKDGLSYYCKECQKKSMKKGLAKEVVRTMDANIAQEMDEMRGLIEQLQAEVESLNKQIERHKGNYDSLYVQKNELTQENFDLKKELEEVTTKRDYYQKQYDELMEALANVKEADELTAEEMVKRLRDAGWEVTCKRVITEEL